MTLPFKHVRMAALALALATLALAACAAPSSPSAPTQTPSGDQATASDAPAASTAPAADAPATSRPEAPATPPPAKKYPRKTGGPLPPQRVDDAPPEVKVDTSCRTDADCTVKNVGNCCGEYPACVNVDSPTDPKGVQARCAKSGMAAVCGFPEIRGCSCVKGTCQAAGGQDVEETVR